MMLSLTIKMKHHHHQTNSKYCTLGWKQSIHRLISMHILKMIIYHYGVAVIMQHFEAEIHLGNICQL